ncbi:MAG: type II methionyl aminopeptidase [Candidatus Nanoarchaeia archaeon]
MKKSDIDDILKAGKISAQVKNYAKTLVKKGMPLIDIANKIEDKIRELGAVPGFPVNLDIDEVAAHFTPRHDDNQIAHGLMKVDIGVSVNGWVADSAVSLDLENSEENKKLIQVAQESIDKVESLLTKDSKPGTIETGQVGKLVQETAESYGFTPIANLCGHQIEQYELHAGINVPSIANGSTNLLDQGYYAIEPFITTGLGKVKDGPPSNIYSLTSDRNVRNPTAREVLQYIIEEYKTLPFTSRWLVKKFGNKALLAIRQLEANGNLHSYPQLIEISGKKVAQREQNFLVLKDKVIMTTKE